MAEKDDGGPVRGILKKGGGKTKKGVGIAVPQDGEKSAAVQWDEMNIMMTEHPEGKDYGHMKINEPKTPYNKSVDSDEEGDTSGEGFTDDLARKVMEAAEKSKPGRWEGESSGSEVDPEELLTEEQREHKRNFREWRKKHYDEFHAVKRARELRKKEEEEEETKDVSTESMDTESEHTAHH